MINFEENIGLVHLQAKVGYKWAQGAGAQMDYEDMFQEASVAFLKAANGFNPEAGVKFSAYYTQVAFSQFRKVIGTMTGVKNLNPTQRAEIAARKEENRRRRSMALPELPNCSYGLSPIAFSQIAVGTDRTISFEDTLEAEGASPEEILEFKQEWEAATARLSPLAALVVQWLRDPPPELMRELKCQEAHADCAAARGIRTRHLRDGLTIANIGRFLKLVADVSDGQWSLVKAELAALGKRMEAV